MIKISDICRELNGDVQNAGDPNQTVTHVHAGDLMSFVMGEAEEGSAWVTVQAHLNAAAVATLKGFPLIILAGGRKAPENLIERCKTEDICIVSVDDSVFGICKKLASLGLEG